ncbi:hypothetical protein [Clostridium thermobutyricum]|uniref:hypothetical protein n=1 Tax=Clostridium thermobutyricum TaxID=29372 RepID=UPI002942E572|nr:hypothetical protein [Clostridium thermobutyricum]
MYCGKELESSNVIICPECGARTKNDINYCTNCGGLRKNKKKKACIFCGNIFENINIKNHRKRTEKKVNNRIGGLIALVIIFFIFIETLIGLYQDITATTGYIDSRTGQYISATQMHFQVPIQILAIIITGFILVKLFIGWINEIRKK